MDEHITFVKVPNVPLIKVHDDLAQFIYDCLSAAGMRLQDDDVVVFVQTVVSKSEGRHVAQPREAPSARALEVAAITGHDRRLFELVLSESNAILKVRQGLLIVEHRLGFVCANAGLDHSNIEAQDGEVVYSLLPLDPDASARRLRDRLGALSGARLAVLIADTHGRPFRNGAVGLAIGVAGMSPLRDARGETDLFGFQLQHTVISSADEIAAAASMLLGQSGEWRPVVILRGARYERGEGSLHELLRARAQDLFRPEPLITLR